MSKVEAAILELVREAAGALTPVAVPVEVSEPIGNPFTAMIESMRANKPNEPDIPQPPEMTDELRSAMYAWWDGIMALRDKQEVEFAWLPNTRFESQRGAVYIKRGTRTAYGESPLDFGRYEKGVMYENLHDLARGITDVEKALSMRFGYVIPPVVHDEYQASRMMTEWNKMFENPSDHLPEAIRWFNHKVFCFFDKYTPSRHPYGAEFGWIASRTDGKKWIWLMSKDLEENARAYPQLEAALKLYFGYELPVVKVTPELIKKLEAEWHRVTSVGANVTVHPRWFPDVYFVKDHLMSDNKFGTFVNPVTDKKYKLTSLNMADALEQHPDIAATVGKMFGYS